MQNFRKLLDLRITKAIKIIATLSKINEFKRNLHICTVSVLQNVPYRINESKVDAITNKNTSI